MGVAGKAPKILYARREALKHRAGSTLPTALKNMSLGHVRRADIGEKIDLEFERRRKQLKRVDFNWFRSRFHY